MISSQSIWSNLQTIKVTSPLIHNITNYVVMEGTANALLALGASPIMAHAIEEVEEIVQLAHSLVLNIGTLSPLWIQAMIIALKTAHAKHIPVVLDPVGAGATHFRTNTVHTLLNEGQISVIRGNASEITSLIDSHCKPKGVDSLIAPLDCLPVAKKVALKNNCVVWMSGQTDVITDGKESYLIYNGHPFMSKVTGMGCMATAITGAFLAINQHTLQGCAHAAATMGIVGEIAAKNSIGPGTFKNAFIDTLYHLSLNSIEKHIRFDIV